MLYKHWVPDGQPYIFIAADLVVLAKELVAKMKIATDEYGFLSSELI